MSVDVKLAALQAAWEVALEEVDLARAYRSEMETQWHNAVKAWRDADEAAFDAETALNAYTSKEAQ